MVSPEGAPDTERPQSRGRIATFIIAALALVFVAVALGALTAPEPEAAAPSTTTTIDAVEEPSIDPETFTVADIAQGEPLAFEHIMSIDDGYPLAMLDHDGWIYLFATDVPTFAGYTEGGLTAWRSRDGTNWESLGQVIDRSHIITDVTASGQGLIAVDGSGHAVTVWRSDDGVEWVPETIEVAGLTENMVVIPTAVGGNDDTIVVAGQIGVDVRSLARETLTDAFGHDVSPASLWLFPDLNQQDLTFQVWGPLGFPLLEINGDDLDMTDEERTMVIDEHRGRNQTSEIWVSSGDGQWRPGNIDATSIASVSVGPNNELLLSGYDNSGNRLWTSMDGLEWERSTFRGAHQTELWNDRIVAQSSGASLVVSDNGDTWDTIRPIGSFPGVTQWHISTMATGPGGIAATVDGFLNQIRNIEDVDPIVLVDGDATLTIEVSGYTLDAGGYRQSWNMTGTKPEEIKVDATSELIAFYHPENGEFLASFGFDDLFDAQYAYFPVSLSDEQHALIFSDDAENWSIQDVGAQIETSFIHLLEVTDTHVVAAVVGGDGRFSPVVPPGFEIWAAPIP